MKDVMKLLYLIFLLSWSVLACAGLAFLWLDWIPSELAARWLGTLLLVAVTSLLFLAATRSYVGCHKPFER